MQQTARDGVEALFILLRVEGFQFAGGDFEGVRVFGNELQLGGGALVFFGEERGLGGGRQGGDFLAAQAFLILAVDVGDFVADLPELKGAGIFSDVVVARGVVIEKNLIADGGLEDGLEAVIILLGDWVEFVIVAAGATDGEAEEDGTGGIHHVDPFLGQVDVFHFEEHVAVGADAVEAGAGAGFGVCGIEFVGGDLLFHKTVIGFVVIEGLHHVVAVAPGEEQVGILLEAGGVAIAGEIEPVAAPFFPVARGGKEAVYGAGPGIRSFVIHEAFDVFFGGRETEQVIGGAADEGEAVGLGGGGDGGGVKFLVYEEVDCIACTGWGGGADRFAEGPPGVGGSGGGGT